jgi:diguanylate cyclase (GGDEF)-like protein/putative nucleotidyltransferase with HDIG domain
VSNSDNIDGGSFLKLIEEMAGEEMGVESAEVSSIKNRVIFYLTGVVFASVSYVVGMWAYTAETVAVGHGTAPGLWVMVKNILPNHPFTFLAWVCAMMTVSVVVGFLFERQIFFRRRAEMKANVDGLTGCYNHRYFQERMTAEIDRAHRYGRCFALAMFDLDDFKAFNDRCGHQEGDRLLKWFADLCRANLRVIDVLARYGGEEFVVIMPESEAEEAQAAANRIREFLQQEVSSRFPGVPSVTVSAGISAYPEHGETRHTLILDADTALYYAKQNGKNKAVIYEESYKKSYRTTSDRLKALLGDENMEAIEALSAAVDAKDHYTHGHSDAVTRYSLALAQRLGLSATEVENLKAAALLHDIGKIGTPDSILRKPGPLKLDEWQIIEDHPRIGSEILEKVQKLSGIVPAVRHHHERYDGLGYPYGLSGKNIPLIARIIALADAYDAMVSDRTYRNALSSGEAMEEIRRCAGTQFDPELVDLFVGIVESASDDEDQDRKVA